MNTSNPSPSPPTIPSDSSEPPLTSFSEAPLIALLDQPLHLLTDQDLQDFLTEIHQIAVSSQARQFRLRHEAESEEDEGGTPKPRKESRPRLDKMKEFFGGLE